MIVVGMLVGVLSGTFGIGGGTVIVPAGSPARLALPAAARSNTVIIVRRKFNMALSNTAVPKYYGMFRDAVIRGEMYSQNLLDALGLDVDEIINMKMTMNEAKYPVEKAKGSAKKYNEL